MNELRTAGAASRDVTRLDGTMNRLNHMVDMLQARVENMEQAVSNIAGYKTESTSKTQPEEVPPNTLYDRIAFECNRIERLTNKLDDEARRLVGA